MESFLRDGVNIQGISERALAGDAHFFDEVVSPSTIKQNLSSNKVSGSKLFQVYIICIYLLHFILFCRILIK